MYLCLCCLNLNERWTQHECKHFISARALLLLLFFFLCSLVNALCSFASVIVFWNSLKWMLFFFAFLLVSSTTVIYHFVRFQYKSTTSNRARDIKHRTFNILRNVFYSLLSFFCCCWRVNGFLWWRPFLCRGKQLERKKY